MVHSHAPEMPGWVRRLVPGAGGGHQPEVSRAASFAVMTTAVPMAAQLPAPELERAVHAAYARIQRQLVAAGGTGGRGRLHPVRCWNFIPRIHDQLGDSSRYMVFNAGRFAALAGSDSRDAGDSRSFPTASGVGYRGDDLVIHCLAAERPGEPIENPRQVPAYRYSHRYGPRPPCFTRATSLVFEPGTPPVLLVAGTASVVGEDSRHAGDLARQIEETFANLDALVTAWQSKMNGHLSNGQPREPDSLRAYYVRETDRDAVVAAILQRYPGVCVLETVRADICRPELLVEVECTFGVGALAPIVHTRDNALGAHRNGDRA